MKKLKGVLLTAKEIKHIDNCTGYGGDDYEYALCKAQCLKLLDVLNQDCKHGFSVIKCAECMFMLEKLLKEGQ